MEVRLKEIALKYPKAPTLERTMVAFKVFEELIPHLGIHQYLMDVIKNEISLSVFTNQNQFTGFSDGSIQTIPFFTMIDRVDRI